MTKKDYMKPTMEVVELKQRFQILAGSTQGMNNALQEDTVNEGW